MTAISATSTTTHIVADTSVTQVEQNYSVQNSENTLNGNAQDPTGNLGSSGGSPDFASMFSNMLADQQAQFANEAGASGSFAPFTTSAMPGMGMMPGMLPPGMGMGIGDSMMDESLINAISNTESSSDQMAQVMLMMMMAMMQSGSGSGGGGGDMSMMQMMISALLPMLDNSSQNLNNSNNNPNINNPHIPPPFMNPANSRFGVETNSVGGVSTSSVAGFGTPILPLNVSLAATPVVRSNMFDRCPVRYRAIIDQFQVETAERYRPGRDGFTYCNIFVLDVVRAMGAHIPHLGAINMCNWLGTTGRQYGWREVDAATAQAHANMGRPAVTSAGRIGHVQMVVPSRTPFNPERGVSIAQAGRVNTNYAPISTIYGGNVLHTRIRYFIHD